MLIVSYVKKCYKCQWGKQYLVHINGEFTGEAAPLWKNASPKCFMVQSILSALMIVAVVVAYVIKINTLDDICSTQYKPWIIGNMIIVCFSGIVDYILYTIKYASDERWFRLIFLILGQVIGLIAVGGLSFYYGLQVLLGIDGTCLEPTTTTTDESTATDTPDELFATGIWMANFFISGSTLLIAVQKLVLLIWLVISFYGSAGKFIAIATQPAEKKFTPKLKSSRDSIYCQRNKYLYSRVVLAFAGLWMFITIIFHENFTLWAISGPCFLVLFGFMLVASELGQNFVLEEFGFLKTFLGRGLFYIFLAGIVCYAYYAIDSSEIAADIYGTIFFSLGVLYLLMNFVPSGHLGNLSRSLAL